LRIGERFIALCEGGLFEVEYLLFDPADIMLRAADPVTVREEGYITTAAQARGRLSEAGVGVKLAETTRAAVSADVARSFSRGVMVAAIEHELGPYELFEGGVFDATAQLYEGVWLDLRALAAALPVPRASIAIQALHLAAVLAEMPDEAPVHLSTRAALAARRPGERTHHRVSISHAYDLPAAIAALSPRVTHVDVEDPARDRARRAELVRRLRARSVSAGDSERRRIEILENELNLTTSNRGPLAEPELGAIDSQLAAGDTRGVDERLDRLEAVRGRTPALRYLRARLALADGSEPPQSIAESLSELADTAESFHEVELLAARAWLAAGDEGHARYFARSIVDDPAAPDALRLLALEIVESTAVTARSNAPPPRPSAMPASEPPVAVVDAPPPGASLPPFTAEPPSARVAPPSGAWRSYGREPIEIVEALSLPSGADESMLAPGAPPKTPLEARIAFTRIARDVARDYRLSYGTTLRTDWIAVDTMQRHLRGRFGQSRDLDARLRDELFRHGALLSEILARTLRAGWVDVSPSEPGYWAMFVPPATRTCPVGRVHRFFAVGNEEKDLVGYCLELEARAHAVDG